MAHEALDFSNTSTTGHNLSFQGQSLETSLSCSCRSVYVPIVFPSLKGVFFRIPAKTEA